MKLVFNLKTTPFKQHLLVNWNIERMYSFLLRKSKLEGQINWQYFDAVLNDFTDLESESVN